MSKVLTWKVVLLGQVGVGKTSIFLRLRENRFVAGKISDGVDTAKLDFEVNGRPVKVFLVRDKLYGVGDERNVFIDFLVPVL